MNGISDWFQNNWIDLARLLVQLAIFAAVVRFGRKLLATLRASQEQIGALVKLSVSDTAPAVQLTPAPSERFEPPAVRIREPELELEREPEPEPEPVFAGASSRPSYAAEREQTLGGRLMGAQTPAFTPPGQRVESPSLTPWVSAPVSAPTGEPMRLTQEAAPLPPRPSASSWLQAPMRSSGGGPWRKMVRWLQAPAGH